MSYYCSRRKTKSVLPICGLEAHNSPRAGQRKPIACQGSASSPGFSTVPPELLNVPSSSLHRLRSKTGARAFFAHSFCGLKFLTQPKAPKIARFPIQVVDKSGTD